MLIHLLSSCSGAEHTQIPSKVTPHTSSVHTASVGQFTWVARNLSVIALASNSVLRSQVMAPSKEVKSRSSSVCAQSNCSSCLRPSIYLTVDYGCMHWCVRSVGECRHHLRTEEGVSARAGAKDSCEPPNADAWDSTQVRRRGSCILTAGSISSHHPAF